MRPRDPRICPGSYQPVERKPGELAVCPKCGRSMNMRAKRYGSLPKHFHDVAAVKR